MHFFESQQIGDNCDQPPWVTCSDKPFFGEICEDQPVTCGDQPSIKVICGD